MGPKAVTGNTNIPRSQAGSQSPAIPTMI